MRADNNEALDASGACVAVSAAIVACAAAAAWVGAARAATAGYPIAPNLHRRRRTVASAP